MSTLILIECDDFESAPVEVVEEYNTKEAAQKRIKELDAEMHEFSYYRSYRLVNSHCPCCGTNVIEHEYDEEQER